MARRATSPGLTELEIVQNPAVGAFLLWQFGLAYQTEGGEAAKLPLLFLVLPLVLHRPTLNVIGTTMKGSGLTLFASKLGTNREDLLAVHGRAMMLRPLTLRSIGFAVNAGLATIDYAEAAVRANTPIGKIRRPEFSERMRGFPRAADKLGFWFAKMSLMQVATTLRVSF